jgi:hypothetical protein
MKKIFQILLFSFCLMMSVFAQTEKILTQTITLKIPGEKGVNGTNGANIAYHPLLKKYYAAMAGNTSYPITVFDLKGKQLSDDSLTAGFDVRGIWYNADTRTIQGNGYNDFGWTNFKLNSKGIPESNTTFLEGMKQPTEQCAGTYDTKNKVVYFLSDRKVIEYNSKTGITTGKEYELKIPLADSLDWGSEDLDPALPERYNRSTVIYTGIPKAEFGLLNTDTKKIELYNKQDGSLTKMLSLPDNTVYENFLNFSFANGQYWLYDKDNRIWTGFKQ